jgi:hypothetical protein
MTSPFQDLTNSRGLIKKLDIKAVKNSTCQQKSNSVLSSEDVSAFKKPISNDNNKENISECSTSSSTPVVKTAINGIKQEKENCKIDNRVESISASSSSSSAASGPKRRKRIEFEGTGDQIDQSDNEEEKNDTHKSSDPEFNQPTGKKMVPNNYVPMSSMRCVFLFNMARTSFENTSSLMKRTSASKK